MEGYVMGSKRLTPTIVGKIASKCLLLLLLLLLLSVLLCTCMWKAWTINKITEKLLIVTEIHYRKRMLRFSLGKENNK